MERSRAKARPPAAAKLNVIGLIDAGIIYLSICLSVCLSIYLPIYLSINICMECFLSWSVSDPHCNRRNCPFTSAET